MEEQYENDPFAREMRSRTAAENGPARERENGQADENANEHLDEKDEEKVDGKEKERFMSFSIRRSTLDMLKVVQAVTQLRNRRHLTMNELLAGFTEKGIMEDHPDAWEIIRQRRSEQD